MKRELFAAVVAVLALCACDDDRPPKQNPTPPQEELKPMPCDGPADEADCRIP